MTRGLARYVTCAIVVIAMATARFAHAGDNVTELTKLLESSSNEKARLAAAVSLAKLGDKRALKPLVTALADPSPKIRAVAAVGLGRLGHKAALPALRNTANDDADDTVRTRAKDAAVKIAQANGLADPFAEPGTALATVAPVKKAHAGFGSTPRALEAQPDLYVVIKSSSDDSPGKADKQTRQWHADIVRQSLASQCRGSPTVTSIAADAKRFGLDLRNIDLSVTKLDVAPNGLYMEVEAQLRLAISDDKGKMLSFVSGGAKVQVSKKTYDAKHLPQLRKEALENAMQGMFDKLLSHLRDKSRS